MGLTTFPTRCATVRSVAVEPTGQDRSAHHEGIIPTPVGPGKRNQYR